MSISPRFPDRRSTFQSLLAASYLKTIWKNHVRQANRQQAITDIADYYDVHLNIKDHIAAVTDEILLGTYRPKPPVRVLLEKSKGLCRQIVIPDPVDALVLQAMVNTLLPAILKNRPSDNAYYQAQAHTISRSRKQLIEEIEYGSHLSWLAFQHAIFNFTKTHEYLVVTDIANYFDHVSFSDLRNIYGSFDGINEDVIDFIFYILENYNWRPDYIPDRSVGLPQMNFDAPRLLAHSFLFELDRYLSKEARGSYVRFMDDMDIGVASIGEAKSILRDIDLVLQARGVRLNSGKTKILPAVEAAAHFFVRDNSILDLLSRTLDRKAIAASTGAEPKSNGRELSFMKSKFRKLWSTRGYFDYGNGEKILKRYLTLFSQNDVEVGDNVLEEIITNRAGLRDYAFKCLVRSGYTRKRYEILRNYLLGENRIDEASLFSGAKAIVDLDCPNRSSFKRDVRHLATVLASQGKIGFVSALWLLSKYGTQSEVIALINDRYTIWANDDWIGRQVGAMYPRLRTNVSHFATFLRLIRVSGNLGAQATYMLHHNMMRDSATPAFRQIAAYLRATSSSQRNGITHHKVLLLKTFMHSRAPQDLKNNLKKIYGALDLDPVQRYLLGKAI